MDVLNFVLMGVPILVPILLVATGARPRIFGTPICSSSVYTPLSLHKKNKGENHESTPGEDLIGVPDAVYLR